jgi:RNAse (barnase) inhibitor barstar
MSEKLDALFSGQRSPGVYRWDAPGSTRALRDEAENHGWRCFYLDGRRIADKKEFIDACARAMHFPDYFGKNWDALEESLRDLEWAPASAGYLVLYDHAGRFLRSRPADFATALAILRSATDHWAGTGTPMAVLIGGLSREGRDIPEL